jgi:predicted nucleotidyltransferase
MMPSSLWLSGRQAGVSSGRGFSSADPEAIITAMGHEVFFQDKREHILRIASKHGARNVRIFGSLARGDAGPDSDVDLLVDLDPGRSLLDLGGLLMDLQDLLGCPVDVVTEAGLRPRIRQIVLEEAVPL